MIGTLSAGWENAAGMLAVLTPLVAVPLMVITFYLRSLREAQSATRSETTRRIDGLESALETLRRQVMQFERDYTTKEEWIRETMLSRRNVERLGETMVRLETEMEHFCALARRFEATGQTPSQPRDRTRPPAPASEPDLVNLDVAPDEGSH